MANSSVKAEGISTHLTSGRGPPRRMSPKELEKATAGWIEKENERVGSKKPPPLSGEDFFAAPVGLSKEVFGSAMVELVMGKEEEKLFMNEKLLYQCPLYENMLTSDFKEGQEKRIKIPQHDVQTGTRFLQWLYTKDYDAPKPRLVETSTEATDTQGGQTTRRDQTVGKDNSHVITHNEEVMQATVVRNIAKQKKEVLPSHDGSAGANLKNDSLSNCDRFILWAQANFHLVPSLHHSPALLAHANLYVLADYLGVPELQRLASKRLRLHVLFIGYGDLTESVSNDIAELAEYVYENTNDHEPGNIDLEEKIRKHVSAFIGGHFDSFSGEVFNNLIFKGGELAADVMQKAKVRYQSLCDINVDLKRTNDELTAPVSTPNKRSKNPKPSGK